ncbi:MAG: hypothetical protein ACI4D2_02650, partial [Lachnospiraceae bacterium]
MNRDRIETILIYIVAAAAWLLAGWLVLNFPSWFMVHSFIPRIEQSDIAANPYTDYCGYRAGEDIPRLESMKEYEEGIYNGLDFVTVKTSEIIPLNVYRLKNPADINRRAENYREMRYSWLKKPLKQYTKRPQHSKYLYGRYYLLGLSDGSYVIAYADMAYGAAAFWGRKVTFPIGRLRTANSKEKELLLEIAEEYPVNTEKILYMINDR